MDFLDNNPQHIDDSENFAKLFAESEKRMQKGELKEGKIVDINDNWVMIDVGTKLEGKIPVAEITDENGQLKFNKGDMIRVHVNEANAERPYVSYKKAIRSEQVKKRIAELGGAHKDKVIEVSVLRKNRGGYIVDWDGIECFMPKFYSAIKQDAKINPAPIKVCIINVKDEDDSIIVSRRRYFEIDNKVQEEVAEEMLESGAAYEGVVKSIMPFGVFVEVKDKNGQGTEGLVHYSEISYKGPVNPATRYEVGDIVSVKALSYDKKQHRLSLSIKATSQDPWKNIKNELQVGDAIKVLVSNVEKYGAFVDLGIDIEGFLHVSEMSWSKHYAQPNTLLSIGDEIAVEVIEIDTENRKLRVSLKNLQEKPIVSFMKNYKVGDVVKGTVATLTDFGVFVSIDGIDCLLHNEDISWDKSIKGKNIYQVGDECETKIIKIDKGTSRISLSKKALEESPADAFATTYPEGSIVTGKVINIQDFGVFIKIDGQDALIRNEDLYPLRKDEIAIDDEIEGVVAFIDRNNNKVRVSVKRLERQKEKDSLKAFNSDDDKMTLGDKLKGKL